MSKKYHVKVSPAPPKFAPIPKWASFETTRCLGCRTCVKNTACVYRVFQKRGFDSETVVDTGDNMCISCMRCVQECKNNIMSRAVNPRFEALGDDYWTADLIANIWKQAESGNIPVSGAGYRGPFSGPGFDQMWTDMSEIVRPTRDGIHGREYISTLIELGAKPDRLEFDDQGQMVAEPPPMIDLPIPWVLDTPAVGINSSAIEKAVARAADMLDSLAITGYEQATNGLGDLRKKLIVKIDPASQSLKDIDGAPAVELQYDDDVADQLAKIKAERPDLIVSIRVPLDENAAERVVALAKNGGEIIHLQAGRKGRGEGERKDVFLTGLIREVHLALVEESIRESVTLLASGGIALAEHVAKAIACGLDGVGVDLALLAAMECRLCENCGDDAGCPVQLENLDPAHGAQRIVNLLGSWHSQLIEVMGAMGLREVRRLRGEVGRAMFYDDLEHDNFEPVFGERKESAKLSSGNPVVDAAARDTNYERPTPPPPEAAWSYPPLGEQIVPSESRYRNQLGRYRVVRTEKCVACGKCAEVCKYGVHVDVGGAMFRPKADLCVGPDRCREEGAYCGDQCPENAILIGPDPNWETFGDPRWPADMIVATWLQAETGRPPTNGLEYRVGASGGGFDKIDFKFPDTPPDPGLKPEDVDLSIPLNRRDDDGRPEVEIGFPIYGGGMSFGSISLATMLSRAKAYAAMNSFTCSGEGGFPGELAEYADNVITQVATGLFGVREETIQRVRIVEFKYAQGAKPGLGGHLLGDKVTPAVAAMREAMVGSALFSPFPFHSVYSVEDHKKHVDWIKHVNPKALVAVKVSTPTDVDMVAVGSYYAGGHIIHIDGSYGGTGAAPDIAKKNIAMPIEYAIPKVHGFLEAEGVRDKMTLIASGGIRSAWDIAKAIALGADGVVIGTAEMVALECIRCGNCESGRGCPRGIATTDSELSTGYGMEYGSQRLLNLFHSFAIQLQEILWRLGMKSVKELVGRVDLIENQDYER